MVYPIKKQTIRFWAEEDKPRVKLLSMGARHLTDVELLTVILSSGVKNFTAMDLAREILDLSKGDLNELFSKSHHDFLEIKGIGNAKASLLAAVFELATRNSASRPKKKKKIMSSADAYVLLKAKLSNIEVEEFWILLLNRANFVIKLECVSKGGVSSTIVDNKIILKSAITHLASSLILFHNHPSGNLTPSTLDIQITEKIKDACSLLDINVLDHIIISQNGYYSFADEGIL